MIGRVKRWLGIEGVKVELIIPDKVEGSESTVNGIIRLHSMHEQTVESITVRMIEKYKRGRKGNKLVDEYTLGTIELIRDISVIPDEPVDIEFELPFERVKSEMDVAEGKNFVFRGAIKTAKMLKGVQSIYRIEAEADVRGTALNPFDARELDVKL